MLFAKEAVGLLFGKKSLARQIYELGIKYSEVMRPYVVYTTPLEGGGDKSPSQRELKQ